MKIMRASSMLHNRLLQFYILRVNTPINFIKHIHNSAFGTILRSGSQMFQLISQLFNKCTHIKNHILYSMHQILLDVKKGNILRMEDNEINIKEAGYSTNYHEIPLNLFSYSLLLSKDKIY